MVITQNGNTQMANIYAGLMRKYGERYVISYMYPTSYLNKFLGGNDSKSKIVLCYFEVGFAKK